MGGLGGMRAIIINVNVSYQLVSYEPFSVLIWVEFAGDFRTSIDLCVEFGCAVFQSAVFLANSLRQGVGDTDKVIPISCGFDDILGELFNHFHCVHT